MSFVYDQKVVDSMYGSHVVSMAVDYGVDLVKMRPLQTNQELENDVKYAENLQVMFSGMMTQVLLKRSEESTSRLRKPYTKAWMCFPASIRKSSAR